MYKSYYQQRNSSRQNGKNKIIYTFFKYFLIFLLLGFILYSVDLLIFRGKIYPNIHCLDINIGKLTRIQAFQMIYPQIEKVITNPIDFRFKQYEKRIIPADNLGMPNSTENILQDAYLIGRKGSLLERLKERIQLTRKPYVISNCFLLDQDQYIEFVIPLEFAINQDAEDAFIFESKRVIREKTGVRIDEEELLKSIYQKMIDILSNPKNEDRIINIPIIHIEPNINTQRLLESINLDQLISEYSTSLEGKEENTFFNIEKAGEVIDGIILKPGEILSFNQIVGPAEKEDGYKESTIIANGQFVNGYGGGVCQVSTTLYNAALLAGLEIIERYNHSVYGDATSYVPLGMDAAVFYGFKDLKIKNSIDQNIVIFCETDEYQLKVKILSESPLEKDIRIISQDMIKKDYEIIEVQNKNNLGQEDKIIQDGVPGYSISTYRIIQDNIGEFKELLSHDQYNSIPMKVLVSE